jgi:hypothetical protein
MMLRSLVSIAALTLMATSATLPLLNGPAQAQAQKPTTSSATVQLPVEVLNISGLERRVAGGHKAKVTYKVTLPEGFSLKRIEGDIIFTLADGKTQTGSYNANTAKVQDTIEIAANGAVLGVDQEPVKIKATIKAIAESPFNGFTTASFRIDGTLIKQQDGDPNQFPLNIDIVRISDFKRQLAGGHQVKVHYKSANAPIGFDAFEGRVKATFLLGGGKTQTNTVRKNNPALTDAVLVDTDGKLFAADGETKQIDTQVAIDGKLVKSNANSRTETCGTGDCKQ